MPNSDVGERDSVTQSPETGDAGVKSRLMEVAGWGWRAGAVCIAILIMVTVVIQGDLVLLVTYIGSALIFTLAVWLMIYILHGEKAYFPKLLNRIVFGSMPFYFWFVIGVLYFGGSFSALWHNASDSAVRGSHFAEGLGTSVVALGLGFPFKFFAPKKWRYVGHMVGTIFMGILVFVANTYARNLSF